MLCGERLKAEGAGGEVELLVIQRVVRDMHFAILANELPVRIDNDGGVVVDAGGAFLKNRADDGNAVSACHLRERRGCRPRDWFGEGKLVVVLRLAEVERA